MIETDVRLLPGDQNHSEASFVPHHAPVSLCGIRERNGFDHWTDSLQGAEGKRVLCIYRRSGHGPCNRTHTEKKRDRIDANRFISSRSSDNELTARSQSSKKGSAHETESIPLTEYFPFRALTPKGINQGVSSFPVSRCSSRHRPRLNWRVRLLSSPLPHQNPFKSYQVAVLLRQYLERFDCWHTIFLDKCRIRLLAKSTPRCAPQGSGLSCTSTRSNSCGCLETTLCLVSAPRSLDRKSGIVKPNARRNS
jgi:hypothetical protein